MGLLHYSIIFNVVLCGTLAYLRVKWFDSNDISWTRKVAKEAEEVAATLCSGHGIAYLDGLESDGKHVCECNACFTSPDCSSISLPCLADADGGDPLFLEPFWKKQKERSGVLTSGWHRLSYRYSDGTAMSVVLEKYILKLHELVGNAVTEGKHIVFGTGSTQLLNAAVHALSSTSSLKPAIVVASIPYYSLYKVQTDYFQTRNYEFKGDASVWKNNTDAEQVFIEFVTSPNNPDAQLKQQVLKGDLAKAIHDRVYYWPHFTAIPSPANEDVMIFSLSKLTGHAGSRFGWALVKDEAVHQKMMNHVLFNTMGVSRETQLRALQLLKVAVDDGGKELFKFGHETMKERWERLKEVFSTSSRFSLQDIPPQFCTYFQQVREPSPAYAWLKCENKEDEDCYQVFKSAGILGRKGRSFGAEDRYVRLSLLKSKDDFEFLLLSLQLLMTSESETYPRNVSAK